MSRSFVVSTRPVPDPRRRVIEVLVDCDGARATWAEVIDGLSQDTPDLRDGLTAAIARTPFAACFWETCPVSRGWQARLFECVLVESLPLARVRADPEPFARHFVRPDGPPIRVFANLGRDALLVVPYPQRPRAPEYAHLAVFLRDGPPAQIDALWRKLGTSIAGRLKRDPTPLWVSTSGLGVSWLHVRLDQRPKYVTWPPFRTAPGR
jgi:hypothetical protein